MVVYVSSHLHICTGGKSELNAEGGSVRRLLEHLDVQYPGIRFRLVDEQDRLRPHIRIFIDDDLIRSLDQSVAGARAVHIVGSLSGG